MDTLVQLVKAGVLGFAVAIMLLAYFALKNLTSQVNARTASLALIAREIRIYMALSLAVVVLGVAWEWMNPKVNIVIDVSPPDIAGYGVRIAGQKIDLPEKNTVLLQNGSLLLLELVGFERKIGSLDLQVQGLTEQVRGLKQAQLNRATTEAERKSESGI